MSLTVPKLEGLDNLARRDGVDTRPTLIRVLTDLYMQKPAHSAEEERHYTELALRLLDAVDLKTRATIAAKLAAYAGAPPAVLKRLARDLIEVAEPILQQSQVLNSQELDAIARDFGADHSAVIAARHAPAPPPANTPTVSRGQDQTPLERAVLRASAADQRTPDLELAELFFAADSSARRVLLMNLADAAENAPLQPITPSAETLAHLETAALARDSRAFGALLQATLAITPAQADRIIEDLSGEPLLVAAKAIQMPSISLQRILMFLNPVIGESVQRVFDLASLYERLPPEAALKIVASMRGVVPARGRRPVHQPVYWDDEKTRARRGSPVLRRAGVQPDARSSGRGDKERQRG